MSSEVIDSFFRECKENKALDCFGFVLLLKSREFSITANKYSFHLGPIRSDNIKAGMWFTPDCNKALLVASLDMMDVGESREHSFFSYLRNKK
jgi:hypothetical protein